jgi:mannose/fructose/N-acetylgalactosamine-specific phosphotransferase system component IID
MRSMLIQACWNFENMQSVGFLYTILPGLEKIYAGEPDKIREAANRHIEFFNTHPYFSSHLAAMSLAFEEMIQKGEVDPSAVNSAKVGLMGSLGAIGDSFFWGSLKPFVSLMSVLAALINPYLGILLLILTYNYFHLRMRIAGFKMSLSSPNGIYQYLKQNNFAEKNEYIRALVMIFLGVYLGFFISRILPSDQKMIFTAIQLIVSVGLIVALEFIYRKIAATSEIVVFSAMFVILISLVMG